MPEYLAPGVYVEETSFRSKSIEGVSTSVAALAGPTRFGPIRGTPELVTSYNDYERIFGDPGRLTFGSDTHLNHCALAARAFFENGGKQLFVSRVVRGGNDTDENGHGSAAVTAVASSSGGELTFAARFPGSGGNLDLEVLWEDTQNLLKTTTLSDAGDIPEGETGLVTVTGSFNDNAGAVSNPGGEANNLIALTALVTRNGGDLEFVANGHALVRHTGDSSDSEVAASGVGDGLVIAALGDLDLTYKRVAAGQPASGALNSDTPAELALAGPLAFPGRDLGTGSEAADRTALEGVRVLRGDLNGAGTELTVVAERNRAANGDNLFSGNFTLNLSALAGNAGAARSLQIHRRFALEVIRRKVSPKDTTGSPGVGEPIYRVAGLSLDNADTGFVGSALPQNPEKKLDFLTLPVTCSTTSNDTGTLYSALLELADANHGLLSPGAASLEEPRYVISLGGGTDGDLPMAVDYAGETDEVKGSTALASLEEVEDISIVATPFAAADAGSHQAVVAEVQKHCARMRYRIGLVDSREGMAISEVRTFRDNFDDSRLALYYPWVVTADPTGFARTVTVPPSGFMAGIYARTDVDRGVHKAPANIPVFGALRFKQEINTFQQELLNPDGINCLRSFPGRGHRVWGGRTLSSDPEWKYVNVRRYFLYLERSIDNGTKWAVFEPNGEQLWSNVQATVSSFLFNEWKSGRLLGGEPDAAFFVRCDRSTMTQNDIDNGRLICEVGVAPLRPAEFVIFRIGQKTADA